jgi:hypothetical protein
VVSVQEGIQHIHGDCDLVPARCFIHNNNVASPHRIFLNSCNLQVTITPVGLGTVPRSAPDSHRFQWRFDLPPERLMNTL